MDMNTISSNECDLTDTFNQRWNSRIWLRLWRSLRRGCVGVGDCLRPPWLIEWLFGGLTNAIISPRINAIAAPLSLYLKGSDWNNKTINYLTIMDDCHSDWYDSCGTHVLQGLNLVACSNTFLYLGMGESVLLGLVLFIFRAVYILHILLEYVNNGNFSVMCIGGMLEAMVIIIMFMFQEIKYEIKRHANEQHTRLIQCFVVLKKSATHCWTCNNKQVFIGKLRIDRITSLSFEIVDVNGNGIFIWPAICFAHIQFLPGLQNDHVRANQGQKQHHFGCKNCQSVDQCWASGDQGFTKFWPCSHIIFALRPS